jgi:hypothetical protein
VSTKLKAVLQRNTCILTFTSVCKVLIGDNVDPLDDTAPEKIPLLKCVPVTSS